MKHSDYPDEYLAMFLKARIAPVKLTFTTHEKAVSFRVELYKYRYAVRDALPQTRGRYNKIMQIRLSISQKTLTLSTKKSKFVEQLNGITNT